MEKIFEDILGCPESVFLPQTRFLQQCTFIRTWNQVCEMSRCLSEQNKMSYVKYKNVVQKISYVIRQNNIKQKTLCVYYFVVKRKKLFGQPNTWIHSKRRGLYIGIKKQIRGIFLTNLKANFWVLRCVDEMLPSSLHKHSAESQSLWPFFFPIFDSIRENYPRFN